MTVAASSGHDLAERFSRVAATYARERTAFDVDMLLGFGEARRLLRIREGVVIDIHTPALPLPSWDFSIRGTEAAWSAYWRPMPQPGWHDIMALAKRGEMHIEGRLEPLMAHLQAIKDLLALARARA